jgi:probable HAF family extracellular repeat protein
LGTFGGTESTADAINNKGQVVGDATFAGNGPWHAFVSTQGGPLVDLGTLGGGVSSASDINDLGQIVGYADVAPHDYMHAFLINGSGPMQDLGTLGGVDSLARAVNNLGQVVGQSYISTNGPGGWHAFIYNGTGPMADLNSLSSLPPGYILREAFDINELGAIVGDATDANGNIKAFLLTPVPLPSALSMGLVLGCLVWLSTRKCIQGTWKFRINLP